MKKIITSLVFAGIASTGFTQNYTINPGNTMDEQIDLNVYAVTTINIAHNNITTDSVEIQWEIVENTMLSGWDYSWCAYLDCFGSNITSGTFDKFGPGETAFFKVNLNPMSVVGNGYVKVRIFDTNTPGVSDTLTYNYNAILGLEDLGLDENIVVYPNPITGSKVTISGLAIGTKVNITNNLGQEVYTNDQHSTSETSTLIGLSLNEGVYFLNLRTAKGAVYSTQKLIVK
ncbi:MAG: T9SS type A sorting domain-containing protein [Crocinitomicaceae bacterium]|nr:T9SS type A sorting domain-containing protein [Crocinitomicaceae bacterium]